MKKISVLLLLLINTISAQTDNTHVVYFETGQFRVPEIETNRLVLFVQSLKDIEIERISIYGFCDDRGTDSYNLVLSQQRADAIKSIFSGFGVDDNLISNVDGKGEILLRIISSENLNIIRGLNRKVEINVTYKNSEPEKIKQKEERFLREDLEVGDKIRLENILFKTGYSYVIEESIPVLEKMAAEKDRLARSLDDMRSDLSSTRDQLSDISGQLNRKHEEYLVFDIISFVIRLQNYLSFLLAL